MDTEGAPRRTGWWRWRLGADRSRGQALIETALILPILLILLLGAIDFGRLFLGWVTLHQAARIGANYAATHPTMTLAEEAEFEALIDRDAAAINCALENPAQPEFTAADGSPTMNPQLGEYARVRLTCDFSMITPLAGVLFGDPITMVASSTFPVRVSGCLSCPTTEPAPPPPPPEECRLVPNMEGMSVAGARLAWRSAGFFAANFAPSSGSETATVKNQSLLQNDPNSSCVPPYAIFSSSVVVTTEQADPVGAGCATAPNLIGITVEDARDAWEASFTGGFFPGDDDDQRVISQETAPASDPGVSCLFTGASIEVELGEPWPPAPPAPCQVPNLVDRKRSAAAAEWQQAGFMTQLQPTKGNFEVKSQTLVGGTYLSCDATITVSPQP
jgi:hypothetical protein